MLALTMLMHVVVRNQGKLADVILERSLMGCLILELYFIFSYEITYRYGSQATLFKDFAIMSAKCSRRTQ